MGKNIEQVQKLREKLIAQKIDQESLRKFDALLHSYERKMVENGTKDLSSQQCAEFERLFVIKRQLI